MTSFLRNYGEMADRIGQHRWSESPLGSIEGWPAGLRIALRLMLSSRRPMVLWWGAHLIHFYNDAYMATLPPFRNTGLLGMQGVDRKDAVWRRIRSAILWVKDGHASRTGLDTPVLMPQENGRKIVYWDYEFLPVDGDGGVDGVLAILRDASEDHLDDLRLTEETANLLELFEQCAGFACVLSGPDHVFEFVNQEFRDFMGPRDYLRRPAREVFPDVAGQGFFKLLDSTYQTGETYAGQNLPIRFLPPGTQEYQEASLNLTYRPLKHADGSIYGIFVDGTHDLRAQAKPIDGVLSLREREVLGWIAAGKTANETAIILGVSKRTCETHIYSAARKMHTANSTQTVVEAMLRGEITLKSRHNP